MNNTIKSKIFTQINKPIRVLLWCPYGIMYSDGGGAGINSQRLYRSSGGGQVLVTVAHGVERHPQVHGFQKFVKIGTLTRPSKISEHIVFLLKSWLWLRSHINEYDVFHGIDAFEATISPAMWAKKSGVPVVVKPASITSIGETRSWRKVFNRPSKRLKAMSSFDAIVAISQAISDSLLEKGVSKDRVVNIPNGVDCDVYCPLEQGDRESLRQKLGIALEEFSIVCVAGLRPAKQIDWILNALRLVRENGLSARLYLVGNQDHESHFDYLVELVQKLELNDMVVFVGEVDDTAPYYQVADIFCLTSKYEGMPNALLESMACGLCCLVTPVSGSKDIVEHGVDGYFVYNHEELARKIVELMSDDLLRQKIGEAARVKALNYSFQKVWGEYFNLLCKVTAVREARD